MEIRILSDSEAVHIHSSDPMPVISRFFGITVAILYRDHEPPHFHARYGDDDVIVEIKSGLVRGHFPRRALALTLEWWKIYKDKLTRQSDICAVAT